MSTIRLTGLLTVCIALALTACQLSELEDVEVAPWDPEFAFPIMNARVDMRDVVAQTDSVRTIESGQDGALRFIYTHKDSTGEMQDLFVFPDQVFSNAYNSPQTGPTAPNQTLNFPTINETYNLLTPSGSSIQQLDLKGGLFIIEGRSEFSQDLEVTITVPDLVKDGQAFSTQLSFDYNGSAPLADSQAVDLTGYSWQLGSGSTSNELNYTIDATMTTTGQPIGPTEELELNFDLQNLQWAYLEGNMGSIPLSDNLRDTVDINLFRTRFEGDIYLTDPVFRMDFWNSTGIPVELDIDSLEGKANNYNGPPLYLTGPGVDSLQPIQIKNPTLGDYPNGNTNPQTSRTINRNNSNIQDVFNPAPRYLRFLAEINNPDQSSFNQFLYDTNQVRLKAEADIPLTGRVENYAVRDTVKLDWPVEENVQYVKFYTEATNGFPLDVWMQLYFARDDEKGFRLLTP